MASKIVLLDVDGVLFTHRPLMNIVRNKIAVYTQKYLETHRNIKMTDKECCLFVDNLYRRTGHTMRGMWQYYGADKHLSLRDFNDEVYDSETLRLLGAHLKYNANVQEQRETAQYFVSKCEAANIPVGIFSNAPQQWCDMIVSNYGLNVDPKLLYTSSHPLFHPRRVKPDTSLYNDISDACTNAKEIIFIDDSSMNIKGATNVRKWKPIEYTSPDSFYDIAFEHLSVGFGTSYTA